MADRTSARLFGRIFELLAKNPTEEHKEFAKEMFAEANGYDFSYSQMDADDSLLALGIAKKGEEGSIIYYGEE